jgi:hypothetical protein
VTTVTQTTTCSTAPSATKTETGQLGDEGDNAEEERRTAMRRAAAQPSCLGRVGGAGGAPGRGLGQRRIPRRRRRTPTSATK